MKVGTNPAVELKNYSKACNRHFSEVLLQYLQEDILRRISESKYANSIWLEDDFPWDSGSERMKFIVSGDYEQILMDILRADEDIQWSYSVRYENDTFVAGLIGQYMQMNVPVTIIFRQADDLQGFPEKKSFKMMLRPVKQVDCFIYKRDALFCQSVFKIVEMLELINDMEAYFIVNEALKSESISGRRVIEGLSELAQSKPKVLKLRRMDQLWTYIDYAYMRKKWESFCKTKEIEESWESVLKRVLSFIDPVWSALCKNEIFFDDWMPELGRFLG